MPKRLLTILILIVAFTILGVTFYGQYRDTKTKTTNENMDERAGVVEPTPEPSYKKAIWYDEENEIQIYIEEVFGESADWGLSVAFCESSFNPNVESDNGLYFGLFQFDHPTFDSNCEGSIWKWKDQVICAKKLYEKGETWRWPNCP